MTKKTGHIIIFSVLIVVLGLFGISWQYFNKQQVNYLIPGVPYYGFYNHFFDANSTFVTSVADILGYWGDEVALPVLFSALTKDDKDNSIYLTTLQLQKFFQAKGYETYRWTANEPGGEINEIKKFVNPNKKIPVIVFQKRSNDSAESAMGSRVVIGVFDGQRKMIVHDHDFGNNYEISYKDFEAMFQPNARAILAVWPSDALAKKIKGPDFSRAYPERWPEMKKIGQLLMKGADSMMFYSQKNYGKTIQLSQELVDDPNFDYLPPAHRVYIYSFLAKNRLSIFLKNPIAFDGAIAFINTKILPLNNNLSQPYKNWTEQVNFFKNHNYNEDKFVYPHYLLGWAYLQKGDKELARKNFEEVLKINPGYKPAQEALEQLK